MFMQNNNFSSRRGSIALARSLCVEIHGFTDENEDFEGNDYGSIDIAEILSAEILRLRKHITELEAVKERNNL